MTPIATLIKEKLQFRTVIYGAWVIMLAGAAVMCFYVGPLITGNHDPVIQNRSLWTALALIAPWYAISLITTNLGRTPGKKREFWMDVAISATVVPLVFYLLTNWMP
jgi:hypothetical protein